MHLILPYQCVWLEASNDPESSELTSKLKIVFGYHHIFISFVIPSFRSKTKIYKLSNPRKTGGPTYSSHPNLQRVTPYWITWFRTELFR